MNVACRRKAGEAVVPGSPKKANSNSAALETRDKIFFAIKGGEDPAQLAASYFASLGVQVGISMTDTVVYENRLSNTSKSMSPTPPCTLSIEHTERGKS